MTVVVVVALLAMASRVVVAQLLPPEGFLNTRSEVYRTKCIPAGTLGTADVYSTGEFISAPRNVGETAIVTRWVRTMWRDPLCTDMRLKITWRGGPRQTRSVPPLDPNTGLPLAPVEQRISFNVSASTSVQPFDDQDVILLNDALIGCPQGVEKTFAVGLDLGLDVPCPLLALPVTECPTFYREAVRTLEGMIMTPPYTAIGIPPAVTGYTCTAPAPRITQPLPATITLDTVDGVNEVYLLTTDPALPEENVPIVEKVSVKSAAFGGDVTLHDGVTGYIEFFTDGANNNDVQIMPALGGLAGLATKWHLHAPTANGDWDVGSTTPRVGINADCSSESIGPLYVGPIATVPGPPGVGPYQAGDLSAKFGLVPPQSDTWDTGTLGGIPYADVDSKLNSMADLASAVLILYKADSVTAVDVPWLCATLDFDRGEGPVTPVTPTPTPAVDTTPTPATIDDVTPTPAVDTTPDPAPTTQTTPSTAPTRNTVLGADSGDEDDGPDGGMIVLGVIVAIIVVAMIVMGVRLYLKNAGGGYSGGGNMNGSATPTPMIAQQKGGFGPKGFASANTHGPGAAYQQEGRMQRSPTIDFTDQAKNGESPFGAAGGGGAFRGGNNSPPPRLSQSGRVPNSRSGGGDHRSGQSLGLGQSRGHQRTASHSSRGHSSARPSRASVSSNNHRQSSSRSSSSRSSSSRSGHRPSHASRSHRSESRY